MEQNDADLRHSALQLAVSCYTQKDQMFSQEILDLAKDFYRFLSEGDGREQHPDTGDTE